MGFDIVPGTPGRMAQVFPRGTAEIHKLQLCWCHPEFKFERHDDVLLGAVFHK